MTRETEIVPTLTVCVASRMSDVHLKYTICKEVQVVGNVLTFLAPDDDTIHAEIVHNEYDLEKWNFTVELEMTTLWVKS